MNEVPQSNASGHDRGQQYLESIVRTASPARLRLLMIEKGVGISEALASVWRDGSAPGSNEHFIKLLEIFISIWRIFTLIHPVQTSCTGRKSIGPFKNITY